MAARLSIGRFVTTAPPDGEARVARLAESVVQRDLALGRLTGAPVHFLQRDAMRSSALVFYKSLQFSAQLGVITFDVEFKVQT